MSDCRIQLIPGISHLVAASIWRWSSEVQRKVNEISFFMLLLYFFLFSGYHRHQGCMKNSHKVKAVFQRPGMSDVKTDYQQTYTLHEDTMPRNPRKPLPRLRNPNPPPMDFRTVQRMDFIERKPEPLQFHKVRWL